MHRLRALRYSVRMSTKEKALLQRLPEQWRSPLSQLLNGSLGQNQKMSALIMRYRCQVTHSAESWDTLLKTLTRKSPFVNDDGDLCFRELLWCFPDSFIQSFLTFILRFQDTVSADSLDRFLNCLQTGNSPPLFYTFSEKLSSILDKRNQISLEDHTNDKLEKKNIHTLHNFNEDSSRNEFSSNKYPHSPAFHENTISNKQATLNPANLFSDGDIFINVDPEEDKNKLQRELLNFDPMDDVHEPLSENLTKQEAPKTNNAVIVITSSDEEPGPSKPGVERMEVTDETDGEGMEERRLHEVKEASQRNPGTSQNTNSPVIGESLKTVECEAGAVFLPHLEKLKEALTTAQGDTTALDLDFLLSVPPSQISQTFAAMEWESVEETAVCCLVPHLVNMADRLSHSASFALVHCILRPIYDELEETPSRQVMSCLSELASAFPDHVASVLCDCLQETPRRSVQSEVVTSLCKEWPTDTLIIFLRKLSRSDMELDDNLLTIIQSIMGKQPGLTPDLVESVLRLLETGAGPMARNAKYGRLVLNFIKFYKSQMNSSHTPSLQAITSVHTSVIRKSLKSAVDSLSP